MCPASKPNFVCLPAGPTGRDRETGAVLLEVVLALVLFVGAAAVLTSGLSSSLDGIERLRRNTHAADLAVTVLSELQMGIKTATLAGPQPFERPLEAWTWEVVNGPVRADSDEAGPYRTVEVIIRHDESGLVHRLGEILRLDEGSGSRDAQPATAQAF